MKDKFENVVAKVLFNLPGICLFIGTILIFLAAGKNDYYAEKYLERPQEVLWWCAIGVCALGIGMFLLALKNKIKRELKNRVKENAATELRRH